MDKIMISKFYKYGFTALGFAFILSQSACDSGGGSVNVVTGCTGSDGSFINGTDQITKCCSGPSGNKIAILPPPKGCPQPKDLNFAKDIIDPTAAAVRTAVASLKEADLGTTQEGLEKDEQTTVLAATADVDVNPDQNRRFSAAKEIKPELLPQSKFNQGGGGGGGSKSENATFSPQAFRAQPSGGQIDPSQSRPTQDYNRFLSSFYASSGGGASGSKSGAKKCNPVTGNCNAGGGNDGEASPSTTVEAFRAPASSEEDNITPEDYFTRIDITKNLFDVVGRRYKREQLEWYARRKGIDLKKFQ